MNIAVAADNQKIAEHFGCCSVFHIFTCENGTIASEQIAPNPGHRRGYLPLFLHDLGVNVMLAGGMGQGALDLFQKHGIDVLIGVEGSPEVAVRAYLAGCLSTAGEACSGRERPENCS